MATKYCTPNHKLCDPKRPLTHLPFKVSGSISAGKSLFSVGLHGADNVKNNQVLSGGERGRSR